MLGSSECCLKHKRLSREQLYWLSIHFLSFCFCKSPWCWLWLTAPPVHLWPQTPLDNVTESYRAPHPLHTSHRSFMYRFQRRKKKCSFSLSFPSLFLRHILLPQVPVEQRKVKWGEGKKLLALTPVFFRMSSSSKLLNMLSRRWKPC